MSIWINGELAPHNYERTLISAEDGHYDHSIAWVEGSNFEIPKKLGSRFGIAGGNIGTNSGISFTKEELLFIASNLKEGATLKFAACNHLDILGVKRDFEKSNNMVKIGPYSFSPKENIENDKS